MVIGYNCTIHHWILCMIWLYAIFVFVAAWWLYRCNGYAPLCHIESLLVSSCMVWWRGHVWPKLIQATVGSTKANVLSKSNGSISLCLSPAAGRCGMLCWTAEQCFPSKPTGSCAKWDAAGSGCCGSRRFGGCFYAYTCLCSQGWGGGWGFWLAYSGSACFAIVCGVLGLVQRVASGFPPSGPHSRQREGQPALSG